MIDLHTDPYDYYDETEEKEEEYIKPVYHNYDEYESHQNEWDTLWQKEEEVVKPSTEPTISTVTEIHEQQESGYFGRKDGTNMSTDNGITLDRNKNINYGWDVKTDMYWERNREKEPQTNIDNDGANKGWDKDIHKNKLRDKHKDKSDNIYEPYLERESNILDIDDQYKEDQFFDRHEEKHRTDHKTEEQDNSHGASEPEVTTDSRDYYFEKKMPIDPLEQPIDAYYEYEQYQDDFYHHHYEY